MDASDLKLFQTHPYHVNNLTEPIMFGPPKDKGTLEGNSPNQVIQQTEATGLLVIFAASIVSNGLIFALFYRKATFRTFSNWFVFNLSLAHLLQSTLLLPFTFASIVTRKWIFGEIWCQMTGTAFICLNVASTLSLLLIAADRNCAVNSPLHYSMAITKKKTGILIAGTWVFAILVAIPPLCGISSFKYRELWHTCTVTWYSKDPYTIAYDCFLTTIGFLFPLVKMSWMYCSMFRAARTNSARARKHSLSASLTEEQVQEVKQKVSSNYTYRRKPYRRRSSSTSQSSIFGDEWKAVRTGVLVVLSFTFCWMPYYIVVLTEAYFNSSHWMPHYFLCLVTLSSYCSCIVDPYLYVFRNRGIRKHVLKLLTCGRGYPSLYNQRNRNDPNIHPANSSCVLQSNSATDLRDVNSVLYKDGEDQWHMTDNGDDVSIHGSDESLHKPEYDPVMTCPKHSRRLLQNIREPDYYGVQTPENRSNWNQREVITNHPESMLIMKLATQNSCGSDTTDNCGTSFESSDDPATYLCPYVQRKDSRSSMTALLVNDNGSYGKIRPSLKRVCSFTAEENELNFLPAVISRFGGMKRTSFAMARFGNQESSESTLTSSTSSDTPDSNTPLSGKPGRIRPKLIRQQSAFVSHLTEPRTRRYPHIEDIHRHANYTFNSEDAVLYRNVKFQNE
ncbi:G-protein coupled receptor 161-like [Centruroides sculpturatus]|uniref:G-protein coupled receptor 161-like n=1 Tax=Centruroides sculpturatus TaxID=218467 RepID=UPI000C6DF5E7|nr:G-protein coupled receptor 161-like [Centruroides sculpturatus]